MDIHNNQPDAQGLLMLALCIMLNMFAKILEWAAPLASAHIPDIVMQLFQIAAWCGAIGVFFIQLTKSNKEK